MCDLNLTDSFSLSKLKSNDHEAHGNMGNSNLKEREKTCRITISIDNK